jgi:hypothetical protein
MYSDYASDATDSSSPQSTVIRTACLLLLCWRRNADQVYLLHYVYAAAAALEFSIEAANMYWQLRRTVFCSDAMYARYL